MGQKTTSETFKTEDRFSFPFDVIDPNPVRATVTRTDENGKERTETSVGKNRSEATNNAREKFNK